MVETMMSWYLQGNQILEKGFRTVLRNGFCFHQFGYLHGPLFDFPGHPSGMGTKDCY